MLEKIELAEWVSSNITDYLMRLTRDEDAAQEVADDFYNAFTDFLGKADLSER